MPYFLGFIIFVFAVVDGYRVYKSTELNTTLKKEYLEVTKDQSEQFKGASKSIVACVSSSYDRSNYYNVDNNKHLKDCIKIYVDSAHNKQEQDYRNSQFVKVKLNPYSINSVL